MSRATMVKKTLIATLLLALATPGCGGSAPKPKPPAPDDEEPFDPPEETAEEAETAPPIDDTPPAPDPQELLADLLVRLSEDVQTLAEAPYGDWPAGAKALSAYDAELAGFEEELPDEAKRIGRLRGLLKDFTVAVEKKRKKPAQKALKALSTELAK